jgi:hypothetical protein
VTYPPAYHPGPEVPAQLEFALKYDGVNLEVLAAIFLLHNFRTRDTENSASGFVFAAGPGLRIWVVDGLAVGYQTRLRYVSLTGDGAAASSEDVFRNASDITASSLGIDGRFSIGVF